MKFITKHILLLFGLLSASASCKKFVQVPAPIDQINSSIIFTDSATATSSIAGLYGQLYDGFFKINMTLLPALSADELIGSSPNSLLDQFQNNTLVNTTSMLGSIWTMYTYIYQANACIAGLNNSTLNTSLKNQLTGEAKFIRALNYFYLVNYFGDVPLITKTDYKSNATLPREKASIVYQQILNDLNDAVSLLPASYVVSSRVRANSYAAMALIARVNLYLNNWTAAEAMATSVINASGYKLESDLNQVYLTTSQEAILQLSPTTPGDNTGDGFLFIPNSTTSVPNNLVAQFLLNAFETNDKRLSNWISSNTISGTTFFYPSKYKAIYSTPATEYQMVLRLSEQYLIRAEARAEQGKLPEAKADIDVIRSRAGLPNTLATDQSSVLLAIEHERQVELCFEWGHRWFDLKRTNRTDAVLGLEKTGWTSKSKLYPIPYNEILLNPVLTQNTGY